MPVQSVTMTPQPGDTAVGLLQTLSGAGNLTINGTNASGGAVSLTAYNVAQRSCVRSMGDDSGLTFTFTGTDLNGNAISEAVTGTNGGWATTTAYFSTITQVASSGATAASVCIGLNDDTVCQFFNIDLYRSPILVAFSVEVSTGANLLYSMQLAQSEAPNDATAPFVVFDPRLVELRKSEVSTSVTPSTGYRIRVTNYVSGTATFRIRQGGI